MISEQGGMEDVALLRLQLSHKPRGSRVGYKIFLNIGGAEKTSQKLPEVSQKTQWILLMDHIRPAPDYADSKNLRRDTEKYMKKSRQGPPHTV